MLGGSGNGQVEAGVILLLRHLIQLKHKSKLVDTLVGSQNCVVQFFSRYSSVSFLCLAVVQDIVRR